MIKRNTWILLAVFVVVLGGAIFLQKTNLFQTPTTPTATAYPPLLGNPTEALTSVKLEDQHGLNIVAKLGTDNQWGIEQPAGMQISQASMQMVISDFNSMYIQSELTRPLPLESTGLQLPVYTLTITYQSGQSHVIKVGNLTATQSGYYVQVDSGNTVIVSQSNIDDVVQLLRSVTFTATPTLSTETTTPQASPDSSLTPASTMTPTP